MTHRTHLSVLAEEDLVSLCEYFMSKGGQALTDRFLEAFESAIALVVTHPGIGSSRAWFKEDLKGVRAFRVSEFSDILVFYRPDEEGIHVIRVLHGTQDLGSVFE